MKSRLMLHSELCDDIHRLYVDKNTDYGDSFQKVRAKIPNAILVRLNDKLNRLESLMEKDEEERKVKSESIDDTLMDIANYALLEMVERRWDEQIEDEEDDEENEDEEVEDEKDDNNLTFSKCIKRLSRGLEGIANMTVRSNTFHHPNYAHYEVFGSLCSYGALGITVIRFDDDGEITGFKQDFVQIYFDETSVDILTNLITNPKMLNDNKINYHAVRDAVWNTMDQCHFQWIITPNNGLTYSFRSYVFDENNDLVKNHVNHFAVIDINRPMTILNVKGMFEKEDEDAA